MFASAKCPNLKLLKLKVFTITKIMILILYLLSFKFYNLS